MTAEYEMETFGKTVLEDTDCKELFTPKLFIDT